MLKKFLQNEKKNNIGAVLFFSGFDDKSNITQSICQFAKDCNAHCINFLPNLSHDIKISDFSKKTIFD